MEEVHLWRGTVAQRALRSPHGDLSRFAYFNRQLDYPDWSGQPVLDFGGNTGSLLRGCGGAISPENYYCIDVLAEAVAEGRKNFPKAHWTHFNRYNCSFNPEGIAALPVPNLGTEFGMIVAYSVFTHTTLEDMKGLVSQLQTRLAPGGVVAFTFIDPHFIAWPEIYEGSNLRWRLERSREMNPDIDIEGLLDLSHGASWCALVDGTEIFVNNNGEWNHRERTQTCMTYNAFHTVEFMQREFPSAEIRAPCNGEMHHCCIMRSEK